MAGRIKQDRSIGSNMQRLRKIAGFSQEGAVAQLQVMGLTISREMLSQMELGKYNVPVRVLLALKELYHVESFDAFFAGLTL